MGATCATACSSACSAPAGEIRVAAEVVAQQFAVDAQVQVEQTGAVAALADVACALVFEPGVQVVDGAEVVVLDRGLVHGDGVGNLHRGLDIEGRRVGQHAAEHRDVDGLARLAQQLQFVVARCALARGAGLRQRLGRGPLVGPDMGELFDLQVVAGVGQLVGLQLAELPGDRARPFTRLLVGHARLRQHRVQFDAEALGALAQVVAAQGRLEDIRRAPRPLQALRRDAQPLRVAEQRGLRPPGVVAVEVGGRVGGQHVKLDETGHGLGSPVGERGAGGESVNR